MQKTMYEVVWISDGKGATTHIRVEPITVIREGILPGCSAVTISAIDSRGDKFNGDPKDYFKSEAEAWETARADLNSTIEAYEQRVAEDQESLKVMLTLAEQIKEK
jgi:hypothetical protein